VFLCFGILLRKSYFKQIDNLIRKQYFNACRRQEGHACKAADYS
jgi:hypothetical protein